MKSFMASPATIERKWYVVDATGYTLGRLSSEIAKVLRGKNKPIFTPHMDCGDYVIVVNADQIKVTGKKLDQKIYYNHSDYVGGMRETTLREMMAKKPERVIELAVKGMLPKGPLGRSMFTKLHVYAGPDHEYSCCRRDRGFASLPGALRKKNIRPPYGLRDIGGKNSIGALYLYQ